MTVGQNIKRLRKEAKLTQEQLADQLGVARSTVTQWERGWSQPRMGKVQKLAEVLGTTPSTIVEGAYPLPGGKKDDSLTSASNADGTALVNESSTGATLASTTPVNATVPLTTLGRVHAGTFSNEEIAEKRIAVPFSVLENHPHARAAIVEGDCMDRVAPEGMAVVYDPDLEPSNGKVVIVETQNYEALLRRWYRGGNTLMLVADSHARYADIVLSDDEPIRLVGTVVWIQSAEELC